MRAARGLRSQLFSFAVVAAVPFGAFAAGQPAAATSWGASAMVKIRPGDPPQNGPWTVDVAAARNEFEAFQVGFSGAARRVTATATDLTGPGGVLHACPDNAEGCVRDVRLYGEPLITLRRASSLDTESATGAWPDALVPQYDEFWGEARDWNVTSRAGESHAIWVEVFVPPGTPAGQYQGSVTVSLDGKALQPVTVRLTVWGFTLPSTASAKSAFGMSYGTIQTGFGWTTYDAARVEDLRYAFGWFALDHRISLSHIDDGWSFTDVSYFTTKYGPLLSGTSPARLAGAKMTALEYFGSDGNINAWSSAFTAKGWEKALFQYTCDEPPATCAWTDIPSRATVAHGAQPTPLRTLVTTTIDEANANGVASAIDVLVPVINFMDDKQGQYATDQRGKYDTFLAPGWPKELWMYQSCMSHGCGGADSWATGWPSYMIDANPVRNRAMQWMLYRYGATGELYWDTGWAMAQQHNDAWRNQWYFSGNGDGTLFYPGTKAKIGGTHDIPIASIRLKMIREGMEDYEYLKILDDCVPGDGMAAATALFPTAYSAGDAGKTAGLVAARAAIADEIVRKGCSP